MAEHFISLHDLAEGAAALEDAIRVHLHPQLPRPRRPVYDGGAALALFVHSIRTADHDLLDSFSLPTGLMPVEAVWEGGLYNDAHGDQREEESVVRAFLSAPDVTLPDRQDYAFGLPDQRFYIRPLFARSQDDADVEAVLRRQHRDNVVLAASLIHPGNAHITSAQAIFFRQLQQYLAAGTEVSKLEGKEQHIYEAKWADLYRPLVYLEKLKQLSERHKQQHGHDPFFLSPTMIQDAFAYDSSVTNYHTVVQHLKGEWLTHWVEQAEGRNWRAEVCGVARDAAVWLYGKWKPLPEGKRMVGLHGHGEKQAWIESRAVEMQDTFYWALELLGETNHQRLQTGRRFMSAALAARGRADASHQA